MNERTYCPDSSCASTHLVGGEQVICGSYTWEDSRKMKHEMERQSALLQSGIIGVQADIMDGELITQEKVTGFTFESEATGGPGKFQCGRKPKAVSVERREWFWETTNLSCSGDICLKEYIATTWQRFFRTREYREIWRDGGGVSAYLAQFAIDELSSNLADLVVNGDYRGTRSEVAHFDGLRKLVNNAFDLSAAEVVTFTFAGAMAAGDFVHVRVGATWNLIPFNTDNATTIQDIVDWIAGLNSTVTNQPLYTVTDNNVDRITVIQNAIGEPVDVFMAVTDSEGVDRSCGTFTPGASGATVTSSTVQETRDAYAPTKFDYTVPTKDNVQDILCALALAIADLVDRFQGREKPSGGRLVASDFTIIISQQFASIISIAQALATSAQGGQMQGFALNGGPALSMPQSQGFFMSAFGLRFYVEPFMRGFELIATPHGNYEFGTDRMNSMFNIRSWYDPDCQKFKMDYEGLAGMHLLKPEMVISNIMCAPGIDNFAAPQPTRKNPRPCIERFCNLSDFGKVQTDTANCAELSYDLTIVEQAGDWLVTVTNGSLTGNAYWEIELSNGTILTSGADNPVFNLPKDVFGALTYRQNNATFPATDFGTCQPLTYSINTETGNFQVSGERVDQTNL